MSQVEYFGGVAYEVGGGDIPFPAKELNEERITMSDAHFKKWLKKYRYDFLRYFHFMKEHYDFDIYEEYEKLDGEEK